ncbi:MAG: GNAT family protein [Candidatus Baltobacteraceae bacterium]
MLDRTVTLETGLVRLEPLSESHLDDLRRNANDPALWEFTYQTNPFDREDTASAWLRDALASDHIPFAIVDTITGEAIGSTRFLDIVPEHRKLEIGWTFVARRFWRTPVNTHCKYLLFQYAFERWGALRVTLKGEAINARSRAAMERIGATYEGTQRNFRVRPPSGESRDVSFYSVIASEWPALKTLLRAKSAIPA